MISRKRLAELTNRFSGRRILVAGDLILDRYLFGKVDRISPEAPVPILRVKREENRPGGAGNVAANILALGGDVQLMGIVGDDEAGKTLRHFFHDQRLVIEDPAFTTITKTRVISQRQQIVRIDRESDGNIPAAGAMQRLLNATLPAAFDAIVVSDYAKGTITRELMHKLAAIATAAAIPLLVDPKPANAHLYKGVTGITPNLAESEAMLGEAIRDIEASARRLRRRLGCRFAIITRGENGITAAERNRRTFHVPAWAHEVYDVTGAGDTVAAVIGLSLSAGASLKEAVFMANAAASLVVEKVGTASVTPGELRQRILERGRGDCENSR